MPKGLSGVTVGRFFKKTNEAMETAGKAHNKNPLENIPKGKVPQPNLATPNNQKLPFSYEDANPLNDRYITGVGNSSNIVVEESIYRDAIRKINIADEKAGEEIYKMACVIEEMCKSIYIVPQTIPRVMSITSRIKDSLPQFRYLTEEVNITTRKLVDEMGRIDQAPDMFKLVVSDRGAEHVINTTKNIVDRQIESMENTAQGYARTADSMRQQGDALKRRADAIKVRVDAMEGQISALEARMMFGGGI